MMILSTVAEQTALVHGEPVARQFAADIAGFGVMIEKKAMIGGDDNIMEMLVFEPVDRRPNPVPGSGWGYGRGCRRGVAVAGGWGALFAGCRCGPADGGDPVFSFDDCSSL
jgi:hypothetical protein